MSSTKIVPIRNKKTGVVWEVPNPSVTFKRIQDEPQNYEIQEHRDKKTLESKE